jgi:diguanylate cyclase (GGDEF)-like protein
MDLSKDVLLKEIQDLRDENKRLKKQIEELNPRDRLTGLLNRSSLYERLEYEAVRTSRGQSYLSLLLIRISDFKGLVEEHGRDTMDVLVKLMSQAITETVRSVDIVGRYEDGGFLLLLPDIQPNKGTVVSERLKKAIDKRISPMGIRIKYSIGVKLYKDEPINELLNETERLAVSSEAEGIGRVHR